MSDPVKCPYCGNDAKLALGTEIYPHRPDLAKKKFWLCQPCDAYVGCHRPNPKFGYKGDEPYGRLANPRLRALKSRAHRWFDPIWKTEQLTRKQAYRWLALQLGISEDACHIGDFDEETCQRVADICRKRAQTQVGTPQ